jgi:hypothetical protein
MNIKHYFLFLLVACFFQPKVFARLGNKIIPDYQITRNERDPSIPKEKSVFVFNFKNIPLPAKITGACNGLQKKIRTNTQGQYILNLNPGKYVFQLYYNNQYFEITTDSINILPGYRIDVEVYFQSSIYPVESKKPVIYLYPQITTPVNIQLDLKGELGFTYPLYNHGWEVVAEPNGTLHIDDKTYAYLFWDGTTQLNMATIPWNEGFIVPTSQLLNFLESTLTTMGLSSTESQDFITYWYPAMSKNEQNYIHFLWNDTYDEYAHITVNPKPDQMFRVYMIWTNAADLNGLQPTPQSIPSFTRNGFTLVEWGGTQLNELPGQHLSLRGN